jgi:hypothetical protein
VRNGQSCLNYVVIKLRCGLKTAVTKSFLFVAFFSPPAEWRHGSAQNPVQSGGPCPLDPLHRPEPGERPFTRPPACCTLRCSQTCAHTCLPTCSAHRFSVMFRWKKAVHGAAQWLVNHVQPDPPAHAGEATSPPSLRPTESEGAHRTSRDRDGTCARCSDECALQPSTSSPLVGEVARQGVTTGMPAQGCAAGAADMPAQGSAAGVHVVSNLRQCQRDSSASTSASTLGSSAQTHSRAFRPLDDDGLCSSSPSSSLPNSATGSCPSHPWERFPFPHPASPYPSAVAGHPAVTPAKKKLVTTPGGGGFVGMSTLGSPQAHGLRKPG